MVMARPRFSILVPTRNRHETLPHAIRTVLNQTFDDYEIIVCDNCSTSDTRAVVSSFSSSKLRYVRSHSPLAMSDNWELAISNATGEYVIVIGDDDGLLPTALDDLAAIVDQTSAPVIRWERVGYRWPSVDANQSPNAIHIPSSFTNRIVNSRRLIREVIKRDANQYVRLPMLYNSAIHSSVLDRLRHRTGRVFCSVTPDIYSGFATAHIVQNFLTIGKPLSINGGSQKSNGLSYNFKPKGHSVSAEFARLNASSDLRANAHVPDVRSLFAAVVIPYLDARRCLFPNRRDPSVSRTTIITKTVKDLRVFSEAEWHESMMKIRATLSNDASLCSWFDKRYLRANPPITTISGDPLATGFSKNSLLLDGKSLNVTNVFDVAVLVHKVLGSKDYGVNPVRVRQSPLRKPLAMFTHLVSEVGRCAKSIRIPATERGVVSG